MNGDVKETHEARDREGTKFPAFSGQATLQKPPGIQPSKALLNLNPIPSGTALSPVISLAHKRLSSHQSSLGYLEWCVDIRYIFLCHYTTHLTLDLLANPSSNTPPLLSNWNLPNCNPSSSLSPGTLVSPLGLWSGPKTHLVIKIKLSLASVPSILPCLLCDTTGGCGI